MLTASQLPSLHPGPSPGLTGCPGFNPFPLLLHMPLSCVLFPSAFPNSFWPGQFIRAKKLIAANDFASEHGLSILN